jgi:hypothetical protein
LGGTLVGDRLARSAHGIDLTMEQAASSRLSTQSAEFAHEWRQPFNASTSTGPPSLSCLRRTALVRHVTDLTGETASASGWSDREVMTFLVAATITRYVDVNSDG